jgi:hypothetical protein
MDTLRETQYTFMMEFRSALLRMRNISHKSCRENQNTYFVIRNVLPNIVSFIMRYVEGLWQIQTGHMTK